MKENPISIHVFLLISRVKLGLYDIPTLVVHLNLSMLERICSRVCRNYLHYCFASAFSLSLHVLYVIGIYISG